MTDSFIVGRQELKQEVYEEMQRREVPFAIATHLGESLDTDEQFIREVLKDLLKEGKLNMMRAGTAKVYWIPDRVE